MCAPSKFYELVILCSLSVIFLLVLNVASATDGGWAAWSRWTPCSVTCGRGIRKRFRACDNPPPSPTGNWCVGKHAQTENCQMIQDCPVDGGWSEWTVWTLCSVSCGEGVQHRYRDCDAPRPRSGGKVCEGISQESQSCFALKECPRDGQWTSWSQWSPCSVTCGDGTSVRRRSCSNPPPSADGRPCEGLDREERNCIALEKCPINGQWSEWSEWRHCSVTCGPGVQRRWRNCNNPPPQHGGADCNEEHAGDVQTRSCNGGVEFCSINGEWTEWSDWGSCNSPNCKANISYSFRKRSCSDPLPAYGGTMCQGNFLQAGLCDRPVNCVVDGGWTEWSEWTCLKNVAYRKRDCQNPPPSKGGKNCTGAPTQHHGSDAEEYREVCSDKPIDDEDFQGSGSGMEREMGEDS